MKQYQKAISILPISILHTETMQITWQPSITISNSKYQYPSLAARKNTLALKTHTLKWFIPSHIRWLQQPGTTSGNKLLEPIAEINLFSYFSCLVGGVSVPHQQALICWQSSESKPHPVNWQIASHPTRRATPYMATRHLWEVLYSFAFEDDVRLVFMTSMIGHKHDSKSARNILNIHYYIL